MCVFSEREDWRTEGRCRCSQKGTRGCLIQYVRVFVALLLFTPHTMRVYIDTKATESEGKETVDNSLKICECVEMIAVLSRDSDPAG